MAPIPSSVSAAQPASRSLAEQHSSRRQPASSSCRFVDMAIAATVAGAFFILFTKLVSCQERLTEVEREMDDVKLTASLQNLADLKAASSVAAADPPYLAEDESDDERIVESSPPPPVPDPPESVDEVDEEEEEETPPPAPAKAPKRRSK